jgi:hypothetical protein
MVIKRLRSVNDAVSKVEQVIMPKPPIYISPMIRTWPKVEKCVAVARHGQSVRDYRALAAVSHEKMVDNLEFPRHIYPPRPAVSRRSRPLADIHTRHGAPVGMVLVCAVL